MMKDSAIPSTSVISQNIIQDSTSTEELQDQLASLLSEQQESEQELELEDRKTGKLKESWQQIRNIPCHRCQKLYCGHEALLSIALGFKNTPYCLICLASGLNRSVSELMEQLSLYIQRHTCFRTVWMIASREEQIEDMLIPICIQSLLATEKSKIVMNTSNNSLRQSNDQSDSRRYPSTNQSESNSQFCQSQQSQSEQSQSQQSENLTQSCSSNRGNPMKTTPDSDLKEPADQLTTAIQSEVFDAGNMGCGNLVLALRLKLKSLPPGTLLTVIAQDPAAPQDLPAWCRMTGHRLLETQHPNYLIQRKD